jgi:hypothetical protein
VTEPQTDLSFADEARRAFDFLRAEHGFELASVEATRVAYRRGDLGIVIALHEEFGFAMVKLQQLAGGRWPHVGEQSLWDLIPEAEKRAVREAPGSELDRYAQALARWGVRLLAT